MVEQFKPNSFKTHQSLGLKCTDSFGATYYMESIRFGAKESVYLELELTLLKVMKPTGTILVY